MTVKMHMLYQALLTIGQALNLAAGVVPQKYQVIVALALTVSQAVLGWYNHYYKPDGTKIIVALLLLLFCSAAQAQVVPPADKTPVFSISQQAIGVKIGGATAAGSDSIGTLTLMDSSKLGLVQLQSDNLLVPEINLQAYLGGVKAYPAFLSNLFSKTTMSSVKPYVHGAFGVVRNVPAVGAAKQHYGAIADLGFDYKVNETFSFGPRIGYFNAPGFGGSPHGAVVSANLTVVLGSR